MYFSVQLKTKQEKNADNILKTVRNFCFSTKHVALPLFWCLNEMASGQKTGNRVISIKSVTTGWNHFCKHVRFYSSYYYRILLRPVVFWAGFHQETIPPQIFHCGSLWYLVALVISVLSTLHCLVDRLLLRSNLYVIYFSLP